MAESSNTKNPKCKPTEWSLDLLRSLEWKRFEQVCAEFFRQLGKLVEVSRRGADGGVDVKVYSNKNQSLEHVIQCKAWSYRVGVKEVRELFGVMVHQAAPKAIFMTTSSFSDDALAFAGEQSNKLFLIDGQKFISMIGGLPESKRQELLDFATEGDYMTPTCASCGVKMVWREKGEFWGCKNYPKCKSKLRVKNTEISGQEKNT
jgi:restriction system protein